MKKNTLLCVTSVLLMLFISCGPIKNVTSASTVSKDIDISKFELTDAVASKMKKFYRGCFLLSRKRPRYFEDSAGVFEKIKEQYPGAKIDSIKARYKDKSDEDFYCTTRKPGDDPEACKVRRYTTRIIRVTYETSKVSKGADNIEATTKYYSYTKICPPPMTSCY